MDPSPITLRWAKSERRDNSRTDWLIRKPEIYPIVNFAHPVPVVLGPILNKWTIVVHAKKAEDTVETVCLCNDFPRPQALFPTKLNFKHRDSGIRRLVISIHELIFVAAFSLAEHPSSAAAATAVTSRSGKPTPLPRSAAAPGSAPHMSLCSNGPSVKTILPPSK